MLDSNMNNMDELLTRKIEEAFRDDCCGGRLKPICNRRIEGYKCRCYVRYVILDDVQYWKIHYLVNQREVKDIEYRYLVMKMYRVATMAISMLKSTGVKVVVYENRIP